MDYMTKPLSRADARRLSKYVRKIFKIGETEPFPVLLALEQLDMLFEGSGYQVLEDEKLPPDVFAWCYPKPEGGFMIEIKQSVYDGACYDKNTAFLCFICHEICHVVLFCIGYTPITTRTLKKDDEIPAYCSVEWQAKALCGELTIPYEATKGMKAKEIMAKYPVTEASAKYRVKQDKIKKNYTRKSGGSNA